METDTNNQNFELPILLRNGEETFYLMKVIRRGFDVYCVGPNAGFHHSQHASGISQFTSENRAKPVDSQPPIAMQSGSAGTPAGRGFQSNSLRDLGRSISLVRTILAIDDPKSDYRTSNRKTDTCFVVNFDDLPGEPTTLELGVWAVPTRNQSGFHQNNPNVDPRLLYKVDHVEPQIWVFAEVY